MAKFYQLQNTGNDAMWIFHCPGCGYAHWIRTEGPEPRWEFNDDADSPTVSPSILVHGSPVVNEEVGMYRCHSFVRNGMIQFLEDCNHSLRGQTVELPQWSEDLS